LAGFLCPCLKNNMYYRPYRRYDGRIGRRVVVAVISALITAGVLYTFFTRLTAGVGGEVGDGGYGHGYG
jgi:hypothetical protein